MMRIATNRPPTTPPTTPPIRAPLALEAVLVAEGIKIVTKLHFGIKVIFAAL